MKSFIVFALIVAAAVAAVPADSRDATIIRQDVNNIGVEGYSFDVETSDGKKASESAVIENLGSEDEAISVRGQFSYPGPDGVVYQVDYVADRNGFQPSAPHLPRA